MMAALTYLLFHSWRNRLLMRIRRLKQPKYLFGAIVGGIYFYFYFFRYLLNTRGVGRSSGLVLTPENAAWIEPLGALVLCGIVLLAWVIPHGRAALVFTEAEVAFLFPAPVKRQTLIHFKLLKSQVRILFTVLFFTVVFGRFMSGGAAWIHALGWWVILSTLNLHLMGASFALTMLMEHGISNWKRRVMVLGLATVVFGGVAVWAHQTIPAPDVEHMKGASDVGYYVQHAFEAGPLPYLLYPFRVVVRPYLQTDAGSFLWALWPALLLMGLHYLWVVRSNVAFEEASVEASKKMAERVAAVRGGRGQMGVNKPKKKKRPPFKLEPIGLPAVGILWKNLIGAGQAFTLRFWLILAAVVVGVGSATAGNSGAMAMVWTTMIGAMALMFLGMSFVLGPQVMRQDFRQDLPMADLLKSYPLQGWQVALGELLAPATILTGVQWLLISLCVGTSVTMGKQIPTELRWAIAIGLAIIAPGLNFVTLLIPNAAVLLFPGWFQAGKDAPQGIEATGQRLIFMVGQLVVFSVALAPAAVVFLGVYLAAQFVVGKYLAIPMASAGALVVLALEAWGGLYWLGRLFEKFDVAGDR